ncbi:MAG: FAD-dependent thymidylate synthase [Patescibacteria group bacterium]
MAARDDNIMPENKRKVYTLKDLPPEVKAVTFAKCSRTSQSFSEIADELTQEKSAEFHEKWVVGYGHSSVAEHAVLNIAVEGISRLATEVLQNNRLASYTERSSRYQVFSEEDFYFPENLENTEEGKLYPEKTRFLMKNYLIFYDKIIAHLKNRLPRKMDEDEKKYEARLKPIALDTARFILPVASLANVGVTMNARVLEYAISKMLSHPLPEVQGLGHDLKKVSQRTLPTLVKYAQPNIYLMETSRALTDLVSHKFTGKSSDQTNVMLVDYSDNARNILVSAILYRFASLSFVEIRSRVSNLSEEEKEKVIDEALKKMGDFDVPLRELEHVNYTFDCLMDEGAYYEFKRHRMCTQTVQDLTIENGLVRPPMLEENEELKNIFDQSVAAAEEMYRSLSAKFPWEAKYFVLNAHKRRVLVTINLRELYHLVKLRAGKMAHFTIQEIARRMYELVKAKHPYLLKYIRFRK